MNELEKLMPEVRRIAGLFDDSLKTRSVFSHGWQIIRAELLRLAAQEYAWQRWIKDRMRVEFLPPEQPK